MLVATAIWLRREGWDIAALSVSPGGGITTLEKRRILRQRLESAGATISRSTRFYSNGPDIVANREGRLWKIECKGLGEGVTSTRRNHFDRALASVVSYLDSPAVELGLALPMEYLFDHRWGNRMPKYLREACRLWVLLYQDQAIDVFEPGSDLPPD